MGSGDISLALSSSDGVTLTTTLSGNSLAISGLGNSGAIKNYAITSTLNQGTLDYSLASSGTLESTDLAGSVVFSTPSIFQSIGSGFPPDVPSPFRSGHRTPAKRLSPSVPDYCMLSVKLTVRGRTCPGSKRMTLCERMSLK